ncbi:MAG: hypothetical protein Q7W38_03000 [Deltaproteobacteria bacterium]|nr:hypothetical protein [Deltaproteobacteria bacterium]
MPKKYHLKPKPAPTRFVTPGPFGIIEGDGCLNCANCVKKFCVYSVFRKRKFDSHQLFDTADSLCKNCFRCVQGCYGRILSQSANPEFWSLGDDYWTPEIIASNQGQAETGKIPVSEEATEDLLPGLVLTACGQICPRSFAPPAMASMGVNISALPSRLVGF